MKTLFLTLYFTQHLLAKKKLVGYPTSQNFDIATDSKYSLT